MVEIRFDKRFIQIFSKIKDDFTKQRIMKQIKKISQNPEIGKPMRFSRKGTRELYISPFRLSYEFFKENNLIYILDLYHKDRQ